MAEAGKHASNFSMWLTGELRSLGSHRRHGYGAAAGFCIAVGAGWWHLRRYMRRGELRRPYIIRDIIDDKSVEDPQAELTTVIEWMQDALIRPIDAQLPGRPFEYDLLAFPFTPLVLLIGNHSAGKSTFINRLLGVSVQETGVAPTDDGFTVLQRHETTSQTEDGPTLLYCRENRPFKELQRFGQAFWGHLKRKRLKLEKESKMLFGLQIVDTPGMIDLPTKAAGNDNYYGGRGYNFLEVVRWFGKRADLILLLFDPDKPGTTGEALDVLTKSLNGLDHKFLIVLNKVDRLDSSIDFARAYGTLGWALSKVIPRKDIPMIYTIYNDGHGEDNKEHKLPLEAFRCKREEVISEVFRAKDRHWDNVITATEDTLRQIQMVATVITAVRNRVWRRRREVQVGGTLVLAIPIAISYRLLHTRWGDPSSWAIAGLASSYFLCCYGLVRFLRDHCRQHEGLQVANLDDYFVEAHKNVFIHSDGEDLRARWTTVRPRIASILAAVPTAAALPSISKTAISGIDAVVQEDVLYARHLAKILRDSQQPVTVTRAQTR
jgi:GTPase SAR1 family protein